MIDTHQSITTVYIYSNVMDEWARMWSGISPVEQVLQANVRQLKEKLATDPTCKIEFILETVALLEATILTMNDARD